MSRRVYAVRCGTDTPPVLQEIARSYGCVYMGKEVEARAERRLNA